MATTEFLHIIKNTELRVATKFTMIVYIFWIRNASANRCDIFYILQKRIFPSTAVIDTPCQLGHECPVLKNNLFFYFILNVRLGHVLFPGCGIRNSTSWKRAENVYRTWFCHREHPRTLFGTHFRHLIRRSPRVSDSKIQTYSRFEASKLA